jgi:ABC-type uncharacterized transport system ATPase subunit
LDEPSAGLDATETVQFGNVLTGVVAERGTGILLVEHDMTLVRQICAHIYMLDFGRLVFDGSPDEMLASDVVRAAYLGSEAVAAAAVSPAQEVAVSESVVEPASAPRRRGRKGEPEC